MSEMTGIIRKASKKLLDLEKFTVEQNHWYNWSGKKLNEISLSYQNLN